MDHSVRSTIKNRSTPLDRNFIKTILFSVLKATLHLHRSHVIHRDIRLDNVLLGGENFVKLAGFSSAVYSNQKLTNDSQFFPAPTNFQDQLYTAPEVLLDQRTFGPEMDLWAIGCLFYELLTLETLFNGKSVADQLHKMNVCLGTPDYRIMGALIQSETQGFKFKENLFGFGFHKLLRKNGLTDPDLRLEVDLLENLVAWDADKRLTAEEALCHEYFGDLVNFKDVKNKRQFGTLVYDPKFSTRPRARLLGLSRNANYADIYRIEKKKAKGNSNNIFQSQKKFTHSQPDQG
jgi:serine/threonine protein kinase